MVCVYNVRNKPKTRKQKNREVGVKHHGVCLCVCVECSEQTQNSTTNQKLKNKNRRVGVKHHGVGGMFKTNPKPDNKPFMLSVCNECYSKRVELLIWYS